MTVRCTSWARHSSRTEVLTRVGAARNHSVHVGLERVFKDGHSGSIDVDHPACTICFFSLRAALARRLMAPNQRSKRDEVERESKLAVESGRYSHSGV